MASSGGELRWAVARPEDTYGDGHVHSVFVEVSDDGIAASGRATFESQTPQTLRDFLTGLGEDWRGWPGTRTWTAMEGEMTLEATHDGTGHVRIAVTLRRARRTYHPDAWSARIVLTLEAGEQLRELASSAGHFLRLPTPNPVPDRSSGSGAARRRGAANAATTDRRRPAAGPVGGHGHGPVRPGLRAGATVMIGVVGVSADAERLARAMFGPEQVPDVLEIIGWYDDVQADEVHRAVLTLSKENVDALLDLVAAAVTDFRDVLMWASHPEPTPEEQAAARARAKEIAREYEQARHRYLVARFGVRGAEQVERSIRNLFGNLRRRDRGDSDSAS